MGRRFVRSLRQNNPIQDGCVLYLPLWSDTLDGSSFQSVDNNRITATVTGATYGSQGRAFDGNDLISINAALTPLAATTQGTFITWVKLTDATPALSGALVSFGDTDASEYIFYFIDTTGKLHGYCADSGSFAWKLDTTNAVVSDGVFANIALVQNGVSPVLYVNGVAVAQSFSDSTDKTKWFSVLTGIDNGRIGCTSYNDTGNTLFVVGALAEVSIFNRALTAPEIAQIYQDTQWRYP